MILAWKWDLTGALIALAALVLHISLVRDPHLRGSSGSPPYPQCCTWPIGCCGGPGPLHETPRLDAGRREANPLVASLSHPLHSAVSE